MDGAEYNTNSEMLIWMWSSNMADTTYGTKFPFAALPMKWFPNKDLRARANKRVVEAIAWDSSSLHALVAQTSSEISPKQNDVTHHLNSQGRCLSTLCISQALFVYG